ncbi:hypothetical protein AVEN_201749-1 [Araneus ventricosus]|uniref:Uncharacterized protein n=1 Tax=Araneus ventricosus TaxID=182803 RepID=A0A4Y2W4J9_ARAVE|nr:hypothetical protein AVEN_201749-1 [Araneus ventricosus]
MANCGKGKRVVVPMEFRLEDDDDGDDIVENTTSLISHTDGMKALEVALFYVEQLSSASTIDVMLIKKWRNYAASFRTSRLLLGTGSEFANITC